MKLLQKSLTARLLILFLLLAVTPLLVVGYVAYASGRQSIISNVEAHLESVAILKEQEIHNWVIHLQHTIGWLAADPHVTVAAATLAAHAAGDPEYLAAYDVLVDKLSRMATLEHLSPVMFLEGASGRIVASSDTSWEGKFRASEPWFVQGKSGTYVSGLSHSIALGRPTMVIATPVRDSEGQLLGVLAGHANLEDLGEIMRERSGLGETGETYLVNSGNLLLTESRFQPGAAFQKWVFTEGARRALEGESGVGLYADYQEEPVIGAYRWLEERDMALLAEIDQAEAFAPVVALRSTILGIGVSVILIVAVVGVFFARTITRPVRQLVAGAEQIGRGNLEQRIEIGARNEIGQLATAFNEMAANLRQSLGETAHSRQLLWVLSQAAQAVQRAHTPKEVYRTLGDEVSRLGYHVMIMTLTEDGKHMALVHHTFESQVLRTAEKLVGLSARGFRAAVRGSGHHQQIISEGQTLFFGQMTEPMTQALPKLARPLIGRLTAMLGIGQGIYAPLWAGSEVQGMIIVTGTDLAEADVPAVTTFANQAAIAIENARLYQEVREHAQNLEARVAERTRDLEAARVAALNMMADADQARREAERTSKRLAREIRERKRVEEDLARSNKELEQFAYVASHDLQEPLRAISGFLQLLQRRYASELDDRADQYITRSVAAATRMKAMINDLLAFSRVGTRGGSLERTDLSSVLAQAMANLQTAIDESDAVITGDPLPAITGDASQLGQLFQNLIGNALKFRGDRQPKIHVGAELRDGGQWLLSVRDNGIGIEPAYFERIFVIFQRLHTRAEYPGTGIGLAICKRIVERHGGRMWVESEPGAGSTFYWTIPASAGDVIPATVDQELRGAQ